MSRKNENLETMGEFRVIFQREWLPELFFYNMNVYIDAINKDGTHKLIKEIWNRLVEKGGENPSDYPLDFEIESYCLKDETYFSAIQMNDLPGLEDNLAIYAMVVFDTETGRTQYFMGETDGVSKGEMINGGKFTFICEMYPIENGFKHRTYVALTDDSKWPMEPINKDKEYEMFVDYALDIFLNGCDIYAEMGIKKNGKYGLIQGGRDD